MKSGPATPSAAGPLATGESQHSGSRNIIRQVRKRLALLTPSAPKLPQGTGGKNMFDALATIARTVMGWGLATTSLVPLKN